MAGIVESQEDGLMSSLTKGIAKLPTEIQDHILIEAIILMQPLNLAEFSLLSKKVRILLLPHLFLSSLYP